MLCHTQDCHLIEQLSLPSQFYQHYPTQAEPFLLGFECQALLRDNLGNQMLYWAKQGYFINRDSSFVSPLESAATLGMKTFSIYKKVPQQANFL